MARIVCLLLLLASLPIPANDASGMRSILIVSRKDLPDRFFRDSVVLITHQGTGGAMGVIVNKPTGITLASALPDIEGARDQKVFMGGPVSAHQLVVVFRSASPPPDSIEMLDGVYLSSSRDVLRDLVAGKRSSGGFRVYAGHAAWAPGQLQAEIARGDWHLERAGAAAIFERRPEDLWRDLYQKANATKVRLELTPP